MNIRHMMCLVTVTVCLSGCATTSNSRECDAHDDSVDIGPLIGLFGMAVDGDDKDDYEHLLHGKKKCKCH